MKVRSLSTSLTLLSLAISTQLYAQTVETDASVQTTAAVTSQKPTQLAPIVVTASRSAQSIAEIAGTVYRIEQEDIAKQAAAGKSTADILGLLVPSLTPSSGTTSNYGMTMRGRTVQYMIDGVPQTGSRDSSRQLNSISPDMIERVEVVSGASSIYGSGATGGIINIITKKGSTEGVHFESKLGVTSGDNFKNDALAYEAYQSAAFKQGDWNGFLGASYTKRGEIQDSHGDRIGPEVAQTDRQDTETIDVNGRLGWQFADKQSISIGAQYYNDEQDSDYGADYGPGLAVLLRGAKPSQKAVKGLELDSQPRTKRAAVNAQYENQDFFGQTLNAEAYYRTEKGRFYPSANYLAHAAHPQKGMYIVTQSETDIDVFGARLALQSKLNLAERALHLTYGVDYDKEKGKQTAQLYDLNTFMSSNGLKFKPLNNYAFGPDVDTEKLGFFLQSQFEVTDRLNLQAGVRHERIDSQVQDSVPYSEAMIADFIPTYNPITLKGGSVKHDATLFNVGALYHLTDAQQVFANFSQGANLPDVQRMLRDVPANFVVSNQTIDPIKVNSFELGWRLQDNALTTGLTAFYNKSDKSLKFGPPNFAIEVIDTDERVYGLEGNVKYAVTDAWNVGGTLAYTRGQFKNTSGKWQELDAIRVAPLKGTVYSDWQFNDGLGLRVQTLAVGGTDKARKDAIEYGSRPPAEIKGFAVMDVIANAKAGPGTLGFGVYNVWNTDYKSVYSQAVSTVYGEISSLAAQGRTYGLSYTLKY
ncbi:TonB-dependent receptor [Acinetobacter sp. C32I]|uniref:TonB-dependent receptor n=1 Tax=Acinetobacter sp. C32I TaxID=2950074 RepID=UPI0020371FF0|nr:TonB-dependent receptor [Acinetobacter sp. C32I]USA54358.1 TonB-dependent receptor [Acinetobacter sp. C32I]